MNPVVHERLPAFATACRKAADHGLMQCSSGNMSWQVDAEYVLVTASRSWMAELTVREVTVCRLADGAVLAGNPPSVESRFHLGILRARPEMSVVLHFQSPAATTLACCDPAKIEYRVLPEVPFYIGQPAVVPFLLPGTEELAEAVIEALTGHDLAVLCNHGQVVVGRDPDDAIQKAVFFEMVCQMLLTGREIRPLPTDAMRALEAMGKDRTGRV